MAAIYTYWISTVLLCLLYLTSAYMYASKRDWVRQALGELGYPAYLVPFMIVVKVLGPAAILSRASIALFTSSSIRPIRLTAPPPPSPPREPPSRRRRRLPGCASADETLSGRRPHRR